MKAMFAITLGLLSLSFACATPATKPGHDAAAHTAIVTEKLEPYSCGSIERLHTYGGIFLGSQPAAEDFQRAKDGGVKTVLNLRKPEEVVGFDERALVEGLGLRYVNVPFAGPSELTDDVLDQARAVLRDDARRPMLVHCHSGNRVGAIWLAHRVLDDGLDYDVAVAEAKEVGLKTPAFEERVKQYIALRPSK